MSKSKSSPGIILGLSTIILMINGGELPLSLTSRACRLLESKFEAANLGIVYPLVYEPINRGRLTVWTGLSTLPTSEFECHPDLNDTSALVVDFSRFVNKLEWTFLDVNKGLTHFGLSVNHCENVKYKIHINDRQSNSYLDCNTIDKIELLELDDESLSVQTYCHDCSHSSSNFINNQIRELLRSKLNDQLIDNLYWHLTQLVSSHHFSGPIKLEGNLYQV